LPPRGIGERIGWTPAHAAAAGIAALVAGPVALEIPAGLPAGIFRAYPPEQVLLEGRVKAMTEGAVDVFYR